MPVHMHRRDDDVNNNVHSGEIIADDFDNNVWNLTKYIVIQTNKNNKFNNDSLTSLRKIF